jgi:hypothetical protein
MEREVDNLQEELDELEDTDESVETDSANHDPIDSSEVDEEIQKSSPPPVSENTLKHYLNGISKYKPKIRSSLLVKESKKAILTLLILLYFLILSLLCPSQTVIEIQVSLFLTL